MLEQLKDAFDMANCVEDKGGLNSLFLTRQRAMNLDECRNPIHTRHIGKSDLETNETYGMNRNNIPSLN